MVHRMNICTSLAIQDFDDLVGRYHQSSRLLGYFHGIRKMILVAVAYQDIVRFYVLDHNILGQFIAPNEWVNQNIAASYFQAETRVSIKSKLQPRLISYKIQDLSP